MNSPSERRRAEAEFTLGLKRKGCSAKRSQSLQRRGVVEFEVVRLLEDLYMNQLEERNLHEIVTSIIVDDDMFKVFRDKMIYGAWVLTC